MRKVKSLWFRIPLFLVFGLAAATSLTRGLQNAFHGSNDLQWSDVVLLKQHVDPYRIYLDGDPGHRLMRWQIPNYLHEMYILELPLAWLSFAGASRAWAVVNVILFAGAIFMLTRFYALDGQRAALFAMAAIASTGFRNSLGNGQQSLFALLSFIAALCSSGRQSRLAGLSGLYAKYNFAPAVFAYFVAKGERAVVFGSLILPGTGYLVFLWLTGGQHPGWLLIEPFLVSRTGITPGKADVMTFVEMLHLFPSRPGIGVLFSYLSGLSLALAYGCFLVRKKVSTPAAAAALAVATLLFVKHVEYDFVLLVVPFCYLLACSRRKISTCGFLVIAYFFYIDRWLPISRLLSPQETRAVYMLLLVALLWIIPRTAHAEGPAPV